MLVLVVLVTSVGVFFRYVLNDPIMWTIELATVAFVWLTFIGASSAMRDDMHIGIDLVTNFLPARAQAGLAIVVNLLMLWLMWFFIQGGWSFAWSAWLKITPLMHWPYTWIDLAVPVGAAMMSIRLLIATARQMRTLWLGKSLPTAENGEVYTT